MSDEKIIIFPSEVTPEPVTAFEPKELGIGELAPSRAAEILHQAVSLIDGDRNVQHGDRHICHKSIALLWDAWDKITNGRNSPKDVAIKMCLLKIVRSEMGSYNQDDLVDAVGYLGMAGEFDAASTLP